jgi:hypothetical protein
MDQPERSSWQDYCCLPSCITPEDVGIGQSWVDRFQSLLGNDGEAGVGTGHMLKKHKMRHRSVRDPKERPSIRSGGATMRFGNAMPPPLSAELRQKLCVKGVALACKGGANANSRHPWSTRHQPPPMDRECEEAQTCISRRRTKLLVWVGRQSRSGREERRWIRPHPMLDGTMRFDESITLRW